MASRKSKPVAMRREALTAYLLISPNLIVFGVFMLLPLVLTFVISTQETSGLGPAEWVGLGNYVELISDGVFWRSLINTVGYAAVTVPLGLPSAWPWPCCSTTRSGCAT
jgi:multiple sugar transport system permease protein